MNTRPTQRWSPWGTASPHLSDDAMLDVHVRRLLGDDLEPAHAAHLTECRPCADALVAVAASLEAAASLTTDAADTLISPDRLARQREIIDRRLDGQPGRVLTFPAVSARRTPHLQRPRRWAAMAAACGLILGLAAGRMLGPVQVPDAARMRTWASPATQATMAQPALDAATADEHLLGEVDAAIAQALHQEFHALDALTPRVTATARRR